MSSVLATTTTISDTVTLVSVMATIADTSVTSISATPTTIQARFQCCKCKATLKESRNV